MGNRIKKIYLIIISLVLSFSFFILFGVFIDKNSPIADLFLALLLMSIISIPLIITVPFFIEKLKESKRKIAEDYEIKLNKRFGECNLCKKKTSFLRNLFYDKCDFCNKKEQERTNKEIEIISKATRLLQEHGILHNNEGGAVITSIFSFEKNIKYAHLLPKNLIRKDGSFAIELDIDYKSLIEKVINNNLDADKIAKSIYERIPIELEKKKIAEREYQLNLRHKAEKEYFGKEKTKRIILDNNLKESVLNRFNNECIICGAKEGLHIHHKDKNPSNNQIDNLMVLCGVCHKKVHMRVR